jgi:hypothetical protein
MTKEPLLLPPEVPSCMPHALESEISGKSSAAYKTPTASQDQLQLPGDGWFRGTPIKDAAPTPHFTGAHEDLNLSPEKESAQPLKTIVTSSLRCTSGPAVNPNEKENRPMSKKIQSAPISVVDLAEQKLIKDFKPASELPSHLHLLDGQDF